MFATTCCCLLAVGRGKPWSMEAVINAPRSKPHPREALASVLDRFIRRRLNRRYHVSAWIGRLKDQAGGCVFPRLHHARVRNQTLRAANPLFHQTIATQCDRVASYPR